MADLLQLIKAFFFVGPLMIITATKFHFARSNQFQELFVFEGLLENCQIDPHEAASKENGRLPVDFTTFLLETCLSGTTHDRHVYQNSMPLSKCTF